MKKLTFAVAAYNLAEVARMVEIGKAAKDQFEVEFIHYGGQFDYVIKDEGFKTTVLEPKLTEKKLKFLKKALNGELINTVGYFKRNEIKSRVASEIEYLTKSQPDAVITGWNLTTGISARYLKIHFVNVLHSTSIKEYYEAGLQTYPDNLDNWLLNFLIPKEKRHKIFNRRVLTAKIPIIPYNKVLSSYNMEGFPNFVEFIEGDTTLLADIPEWVNHKYLRSKLYHIGPLPAKLNVPIPQVIKNMKTDLPIIYFAMGSSGKADLMKEIVEGFEGKPYRVIAPIKKHIEKLSVKVPNNVVVTGFVPAHIVNKMADISVIHGGQNTVMNACLSKTPIVGIGMHVEQQANLDACVRKGFAIRLSKKYVTPNQVHDAIDQLLNDKNAKKQVTDFGEALAKWDGPKNAVEVLEKVIQ